MKDERLIVRTMERLGIATAYGNRTQAIDYLNRVTPASCGFVAYNPFMPARVGWENYTIYIGGEDDMLKARILEGELTKWFNVRYEQYPRTSGTHIMMNVSVRAKGHLIGAYMGGGGQQEPDALNFTMPNGGTITLTRNGLPITVTLEYTLDGGATWTEWTENGTTRTLTLNAGEKVYIRNTSDTSTGFSLGTGVNYRFSFSDTTEAHGNINSLLCKNPADAVITNYCFFALFSNCSTLTTSPELSATEIAEGCYYNMFSGCSALTEMPELPATAMFSSCYFAMFNACSSLVTTRPIRAITGAPDACRNMFLDCVNMEVAPELYTETLGDNNYRAMFWRCSKLKSVTTHMTDISASSCLYYWLASVASTGDIYCPQSLTIPTGGSGIPSGWTRHDI